MKIKRIAKVELLVGGVGFVMKVMGLFCGTRVERQKEIVAQEEAYMAALYEEYDTIQASIDVDALFAAKLQQEEREQFTIEERA
ncbi:hypothetical protein Tco_0916978 [Tanacetum coccineum]